MSCRCPVAWPTAGGLAVCNARSGAGPARPEPQAESVLACALRPLDFRDCPVTFTSDEQARLRQAFPTGVCDYTRPGTGQHQKATTWRDYGGRSRG
ncbi:DUF6351 family protein [Kitasatospora sp. NPDC101155]|uniref:DUF6351 family protein n=1 Tax=Kitasatospora sp. NPDC101155 TaxID=3364097 RepID=UPI0037F446FF